MRSVLEIANRCARVATLAARRARAGRSALRPDLEAALLLAAQASEVCLQLAEANLLRTGDGDEARNARREVWRTRLVLQRARTAGATPVTTSR